MQHIDGVGGQDLELRFPLLDSVDIARSAIPSLQNRWEVPIDAFCIARLWTFLFVVTLSRGQAFSTTRGSNRSATVCLFRKLRPTKMFLARYCGRCLDVQ